MAVSMTPNFNRGELRKMVAKRVEGFNNAVVMALQRAGEEFITVARDSVANGLGLESVIKGIKTQPTNPNTGLKTYWDQTKNLRSSIGYVIMKNGQQIFGDFPGDKPEGVAQAKEVAQQVGAKFNNGFVLIVVAGMDYAAAVESKGYDVITGSAPIAEEMLRKAMERLQKKADTLI
jgi:hypothetical protein